MTRAALLLLPLMTLAGGCAYKPGSFHAPIEPETSQFGHFAGTRVTVGCFDVAIAPRKIEDDGGGIVVEYEIGNRCDSAQVLDLAHLRVVGRVEPHREVKLVAFDPDAELAPVVVDGRTYARESIAYRDPRGAVVESACIDADSIVHAPGHRWVCLETPVEPEPAADDDDECTVAANHDYVGNHHCTPRFGAWAALTRFPSMAFDWGFLVRGVSLPTGTHGAARVSPAYVTDFRMVGGLRGGLYLGIDVDAGGVGGSNPTGETDPSGAPLTLGGYGVLGVRGAVHRFSLGAEVLAGGRLIQGAVDDPAVGTGATVGRTFDQGVVELRVRGEAWLDPWISFGLTAGADVLRSGEPLGGLYFSFHSRAYAGERR